WEVRVVEGAGGQGGGGDAQGVHREPGRPGRLPARRHARRPLLPARPRPGPDARSRGRTEHARGDASIQDQPQGHHHQGTVSRSPARPAGVVLTIAIVLAWGDGARPVRAADPCSTTVGSVSGTVIAQGGGPLAGARVRVQGCVGDPVLTAADGSFTLPVPAGAVVVAAAQQGYFTGCALGTPPNCATHTAGDTGLPIALHPLPA